MNKIYYSFGNPFKLKFRKHYCSNCGSKLSMIKHCKIVSQKSSEAKYNDFHFSSSGYPIGPCEFIHKVFYCPRCLRIIEFVTQLNQEDNDIIIKKVIKHFNKKGRNINIKKCYENVNNEIVDNCSAKSIKNLCLYIEENNKKTLVYKIPITIIKCWERPYRFKIKKKNLIKFIEKYN